MTKQEQEEEICLLESVGVTVFLDSGSKDEKLSKQAMQLLTMRSMMQASGFGHERQRQ